MSALSDLKGVGPKTLSQLTRLNIYTLEDLLLHLPLRYEDRSAIRPIQTLHPGDRVMIEGHVSQVAIVGKRRQLTCRLTDTFGGVITVKFFHFTAYQRQRLAAEGVKLRCLGECRQGFRGGFEIIHPEYAILPITDDRLALSDCLIPIYPTTQGLNQTTLRKLMSQALSLLEDAQCCEEYLPARLRQLQGLVTFRDAIAYVHAPPLDADQALLQAGRHMMQQRLAFEELLAHQLSLARMKQMTQQHAAWPMPASTQLIPALLAVLPFTLTEAQQRVLATVQADLARSIPMLRLVQGDVGSGKTIVAALAALQAIEAGFQVAIMAPTELLAEQHRRNFQNWFASFNISVGLLVGNQTVGERQVLLSGLASGELDCVVGTHALFQPDVIFQKLALIIVDEQHRFGVEQRLLLHQKGLVDGHYPHQLVMTATPIPRTLAMTAYADLDYSVIDALPPGRQPIQTILVPQSRRDEVITRLAANCLAGKQAYWVCTLIDESEALSCQPAIEAWESLSAALPELNIGLLHGRMKSEEKEAIMSAFQAGTLQVLVATTVIEVGVDVQNATLMVIDNPERFGLSQLHQLRGRVGRGSTASFCVLLYGKDLSEYSEARLKVMRQTSDGFAVAEADLQLRGPGEVLGTRQSGLMRFKIADLMRDQALLAPVKACAEQLLVHYPDVVSALLDRWLQQRETFLKV